jgi:hypothetical protein
MKTITTTIRQTVKNEGDEKGKRKEIGKVSFLVPTLEEVRDHLNTEPAFVHEKDGEKVLDSYESTFSQFIDDAIEAACRVKLAAKLQAKSVQLKPGQTLWTSIAELCAIPSTRGQHFVVQAAFKTSVTAFVAGLKKSDGWKANVLNYLLNADALAETTEGNKKVVQNILDAFLETLDDDDVTKYERILSDLGKAIVFKGNSLEDEE